VIPTSDKPKSKSAVRDEPRFLYDCMPCLFRQLLLAVLDVEVNKGLLIAPVTSRNHALSVK
jgi:hypothetical protein